MYYCFDQIYLSLFHFISLFWMQIGEANWTQTIQIHCSLFRNLIRSKCRIFHLFSQWNGLTSSYHSSGFHLGSRQCGQLSGHCGQGRGVLGLASGLIYPSSGRKGKNGLRSPNGLGNILTSGELPGKIQPDIAMGSSRLVAIRFCCTDFSCKP